VGGLLCATLIGSSRRSESSSESAGSSNDGAAVTGADSRRRCSVHPACDDYRPSVISTSALGQCTIDDSDSFERKPIDSRLVTVAIFTHPAPQYLRMLLLQ